MGHGRVLCEWLIDFLTSIQRAGCVAVNHRGGVGRLALVSLAVSILAGCSGEYSILDPAGPAARDQFWVWWAMFAVSMVVSVVIFALWIFTFLKKSHPQRTPREERRIALRWILGGGVALPLVSIIALLTFGVPTGKRMLPLPLPDGETAEVIEVIGHQWWWEIRYPGAEGETVVTANHLVMPAGEPVDFHLTSNDVIHAFWIPRLGGKIDMVPARDNYIRLEADYPGIFSGQCAEFCGAQHTTMQLFVEAMERDEYEAWLAARQSPPQQQERHDEAREAFVEHCAGCHRVAGLPHDIQASGPVYRGIEGPDLSDIGSRATLGAGRLAMEEGAIAYWLEHHQLLKPGNRMPAHNHIDTETLQSIGSWLETLTP
ncbi:cytochrome c oxidase subunit II [Vreelandella populi]|uniref:cytochrome c oxidase subunit II n=1 Tax=Halomonadaceae TaxID=28256 RepID=UPI0030EC2B7C